MSASPVPEMTSDREVVRRPRLGLVAASPNRMGRLSFVLVVCGILVAGAVGLLVLNTHLNSQALTADRLRSEAAALEYRQGELKDQVIDASSTRELTRKASAMGMRPNDHIAFLDLRTGEVSGDTTPADGQARPESVVLTQEEEQDSRESRAEEYAQSRRVEAETAMAEAAERARAAQPQQSAEPQPAEPQQPPADQPAFPGQTPPQQQPPQQQPQQTAEEQATQQTREP